LRALLISRIQTQEIKDLLLMESHWGGDKRTWNQRMKAENFDQFIDRSRKQMGTESIFKPIP